MKSARLFAATGAVTLVTAGAALAASAVRGRMTSDGCTGRPDVGHGWGEEVIHLTPLVTGVTGGGCTTLVGPQGWYSIEGTFTGGNYLFSTGTFDRAPAFSVSPITLPGGSVVVDPVEFRTPAHYSVAYNQNYTEWGSEPWIWGESFYQTFTATTPYVTRMATRLAGKGGDHHWLSLNFAIYRPNAGPPSTWPRVSPVRSFWYGGNVDPIIVMGWVPFRSNEMSLVIGEAYAARLWVAPGSQSTNFAVVARTDRGDGYAGGHLYVGDTPRTDLDAYGYFSGGTPETLTNHAPVNSYALTSIANWTTSFGQTFTASGNGLAGASITYTTGQPDNPSLPIEFQLYSAPGGTVIGPQRTTHGVRGYYQGRAAVAWERGEVPLIPGQSYYLEWSPPPSGCNTWYMNEDLPGAAYVGGVSRAPQDLMMIISEYEEGRPMIGLDKETLVWSVEQGSPAFTDTLGVRSANAVAMTYSLAEKSSWLSLSPTSGDSSGEEDPITLTISPTGLVIGTYTGNITITSPESANSPRLVPVALTITPHPGDMNRDSDVDLEDWGLFQVCLTASGEPQNAPACARAKLDEDSDVDSDDVEMFAACLSAPGIPATVGCGR